MEQKTVKDMRGYLFPNKNKLKASQPDLVGKFVFKGEEIRLSAWENITPEGVKFLSISVSIAKPQEKTEATNETKQSTVKEPKDYPHISNDLEDLDAILNSADDDNPFN